MTFNLRIVDASDEGTKAIDKEEAVININLKSFLKLKKKDHK